MYKYDFHKYHALGNDYIVIDPRHTSFVVNKSNIQKLCHRHYGLGSDGVLVGPFGQSGEFKLSIFNPDGTEAEKSGNGIRIFARYLVDAGDVGMEKFRLQTLGGQVEVEILDEVGSQIRVNMGKVSFQSRMIPVLGEAREVVDEELEIDGQVIQITCLTIGNPHCVILRPVLSRELAEQWGPMIERLACFPNRINVQFMKVMDRGTIQIEIWERGAGYTLASGSSSCAAASAAFRLGLVDHHVNVHMPGGVIQIELAADGDILMTGPVEFIARGDLPSRNQ